MDVDFGVDQPRSATASTGGGHTAERAEFDDILVSKMTDLSSTIGGWDLSANKIVA